MDYDEMQTDRALVRLQALVRALDRAMWVYKQGLSTADEAVAMLELAATRDIQEAEASCES